MIRSIPSALLATLFAAALAGCANQGLEDDRFATGSSAIVAGSSFQALYTANPDQATVSRIDSQTGAVAELEVGLEPTRIARAGDVLIATLRNERALAVIDEATFTLRERLPTGAEPYGVVATEDGSRFYVAVSLAGVVQEWDTASLTKLRSWPVEGEPRWLALHPNGDSLYVGSAFGGLVHYIDLPSDLVSLVDVPTVMGFHPTTGEEVALTPRITGDLAISPDGSTLAIPTMQVENSSPGGDLSAPNPGAAVYYAPPGGGRFNAVLLTTAVVGGGEPSEEYWDATLLNVQHADLGTVAGYPSSATFTPDGDTIMLTIESGEAVVSVPTRASGVSARSGTRNTQGWLQLGTRTQGIAHSSRGPRGVAFDAAGEGYVFAYHEGAVERIKASALAEQATPRGSTNPLYVGATSFDFEVSGLSTAKAHASDRMFEDMVLTLDQQAGRDLFFSSVDDRMAFNGAGVSCSTCHFEGRNDGLNWPLERGARQTPSLAGDVSQTAPVTWADGVPSVGDEAFATSQGRMGGFGLSQDSADKVAAFIDFGRHVDVPTRGMQTAQILAGEEIFNRADVGCGDCHGGATLQDGASHDMLGLSAVNTPTLVGITATAPYFHDGSAPTLRAVLEYARSGAMGDTSMLDDSEMDALEAYLTSL